MVIQPQHFIIVDVVLYHNILGFDTTFGDILCDNSGDIFEAIFVDNFNDNFDDNFDNSFDATFDNTFDAFFDDTSVDTSCATSGDSDIDESIAPRKNNC